jgi:spore coat protein U-like protein
VRLLIKFILIFFCVLLTGKTYAACNVTTTNINFGNYDVFLTTPKDSTGSITVSCDESPAPNVIISLGPSPTSGGFNPRNMKHSTKSDLLNYNLFTTSSQNVVWGDGTSGTSTVTITKVKKLDPPRVTIVYGGIPAGQDISAGTYSETLTVTITW